VKRRAIEIAAVVLFCLTMVVVRVVWSARSEFLSAEDALAKNDPAEAIVRLRRAARWYAPGNPYVRRALDGLQEIANRAENAGDGRTARAAWEAIRTAILSTRSVYTPYAERLPPANEHIARLLAHEEGEKADPGKSEGERAAWHLALLARDDQPLVGFTLLALVGFFGWVSGALAFIYKGIDAEDHLRPRAALWSAVAVIAGFAAFLVGLARA
jgi:hypothetical protein